MAVFAIGIMPAGRKGDERMFRLTTKHFTVFNL